MKQAVTGQTWRPLVIRKEIEKLKKKLSGALDDLEGKSLEEFTEVAKERLRGVLVSNFLDNLPSPTVKVLDSDGGGGTIDFRVSVPRWMAENPTSD